MAKGAGQPFLHKRVLKEASSWGCQNPSGTFCLSNWAKKGASLKRCRLAELGWKRWFPRKSSQTLLKPPEDLNNGHFASGLQNQEWHFFPNSSPFYIFNYMLKIKSNWDPHPHRPVWGSITSWAVGVPAVPGAMALVKRGDLERKRSREIKPFYTGNQLKWVKGLFLPRAPRPSGSDSIDAILKACHIHCVLKHLIICDSLQRGSLSSALLGGVMCS